jgi:hypothetical protein
MVVMLAVQVEVEVVAVEDPVLLVMALVLLDPLQRQVVTAELLVPMVAMEQMRQRLLHLL